MDKYGSIARHFSKGSEVYEQEASLQREIANELLRRIKLEQKPAKLLDVGCGTGFLTSLLARSFPYSHVDAIDISAAMLRKARGLVTEGAIQWLAGDAKSYSFPNRYDLVASSSAIQWIYPQTELFRHLNATMNPGGRLCFSVMLRGTMKELHELRQVIAPNKPLRLELATAYEIGTALRASGMAIIHLEEKIYRREYSSAADFLWRIKEQGFTGGEVSTADRALTRGELRELTVQYQKEFRSTHGGVYATYCVGFFEARAAEPGE